MIAAFLSGCFQTSDLGDIHQHQGRSYRLHVPSESSHAPLVIVMHGYGGSAEWMEKQLGWIKLADQEGFAVCFPNGTIDDTGRQFWNVGYAMHEQSAVDDVAYVVSLVQRLRAMDSIHPNLAYATGFSNGADMSYLLACEAPETFAAIGPVAGTMMDSLYFQSSPVSPCSVIAFSGTHDEITRFDGDPENRDGWGAYRSVPEVIDFWVEANQLTEFEQVTLSDSTASENPGLELDRYWSTNRSVEVRFYRITGGGHDWPIPSETYPVDATRMIWDFFASHRPESN